MFGIRELGNYKRIIVLLADILLVHATYLFSFLIRYGYPFPEYNFSSYRLMVPFITLGTAILFSVYGLLHITRKTRIEMIQSVFLSVIMLNVLTMAATFFMRTFSFPRGIFLLAMLFQMVLISAFYLLILAIQQKQHENRVIAVIGSLIESKAAAEKIMTKYPGWFSGIVLCSEEQPEALETIIKESDWVFLCSGISHKMKKRIIQWCIQYQKELQLVPDFHDIMHVGAAVGQIDDLPMLRVDTIHLSVEQRLLKRGMDLLISFVSLVLLLPLIILIAAFIKATSPGPVFFRQKRMTRDGKEFNLYKFRSMVDHAEEETGPVLALENDQRITKVGNWLRSTRLDEVPQLLNVFMGYMSLVGPRPERRIFVEEFEQKIPTYRYRKTVKAGITGLAQVKGKYSTSVEDKLRMDLLYIRNYSFWLDIILLLQTVQVILNLDQSKGLSETDSLEEKAARLGFNLITENNRICIIKNEE